MSLGEPQYPRKQYWFEEPDIKLVLFIIILSLACLVLMIVNLW